VKGGWGERNPLPQKDIFKGGIGVTPVRKNTPRRLSHGKRTMAGETRRGGVGKGKGIL